MPPAFVESCIETVSESAKAVYRLTRSKPRARKLVRLLAGKRKVLVTTHMHPDPDALGSALCMSHLLKVSLPQAQVHLSIKGQVGGGVNAAFTKLTNLNLVTWDDHALPEYDAIVLLDVQPNFAYSPLPLREDGTRWEATAVIDHHPSRGPRPKAPFVDIRTDVGAASSIVFAYFMELELDIPPDLGASLLFAIESDLAGAAGAPGGLDNMALSSLTLIADARKLYQMRYVNLPRSYFTTFADGLANAVQFGNVLVTHLDEIDSLEKPAVLADFLLRYEETAWVLVTARREDRLILSLRTQSRQMSAGQVMRRLVRGIGVGGGHRTKAGGFIQLSGRNDHEVERYRKRLRVRLVRAVKVTENVGRPLVSVPTAEEIKQRRKPLARKPKNPALRPVPPIPPVPLLDNRSDNSPQPQPPAHSAALAPPEPVTTPATPTDVIPPEDEQP
ncbi:MAG: bifunctional oligoribonuclease/PAP phosphatase NrnA [Phycisphaerae bacterium]